MMTEDISKQLARATGHSRQLSAFHCRHFDGVFPLTKDRKCLAGVRYMKMNPKPIHQGWMGELPCLKRNECDTKCKKRDFPTDEELRAADRLTQDQWEAFFQATKDVIPIIRADADSHSKLSGTVVCPLCQAPMHYTIRGRRGHIHASCTTEGCLSFME